jgi:hypothetical protein
MLLKLKTTKGIKKMKKLYTVQLTFPCYPSKGYKIDVLNGDWIHGDMRDYLSSDLIKAFLVKAENKKQALSEVIYNLAKEADRLNNNKNFSLVDFS